MLLNIPPLLLVALSISSATQAATLPTNNMARQVFYVDCEFQNGNYAYPGSPTAYIECRDGETNIKYCPRNTVFDPITAKCQAVPIVASATTETRRNVVRQSDFECPTLDGAYPDAENPSAYYLCINGIAFSQLCGAGHFNPDTKQCELDEEADPSTIKRNMARQTDFVCPEPFGSYPYPEDVATPDDDGKYFQCENGVSTLRECSDGLPFDPALGTCVDPGI